MAQIFSFSGCEEVTNKPKQNANKDHSQQCKRIEPYRNTGVGANKSNVTRASGGRRDRYQGQDWDPQEERSNTNKHKKIQENTRQDKTKDKAVR
jgi:hypothetical protein